ncbi:amylo-alpha-1,6-glucosidase [Gryllotalpicola ginsengisoli]|uniref:amylo-alpha-1,6-glucosidase n=1 Tax=Gryllotalpicola ginsengisoli TaxID=444608 RepID=UPI0003B75A79|nr:glycogen debranching N-terminal domain-containing protein [Gryllotalpicola ginsengisoli]
MSDPNQPASNQGIITVAPTTVTLVEGSSFCVSSANGDIHGERSEGLFVRDTRLLSRWALHIDGAPVEALSAIPAEPYEARFIGRAAARPGQVEPTLVVERSRYIGQGMREDITLRNFGQEAAGVELRLAVDADFADLFEVKEHRPPRGRHVSRRAVGSDLVLWTEHGDGRGVRVSAPGAIALEHQLRFDAVVPAGGEWSATVEVVASVDGQELAASFPLGEPVDDAEPARRMRGWRASVPDITVADPALAQALERSEQDLGALRIVDPRHPNDDVVAAGAPWFMALFGRDSLITSWMTLPFSPELAMGTLRTLARMQGRKVDPLTEEEPGRILHEVRLGADLSLALGGDSVYYGSIDSTPLFVMLVGQAARWGVPLDQLEPLRPAVDAAVRWIVEYGDRDGDGFVEYQRGTDRGLLNQGWKDSFDAIAFRDGAAATAPIALAEVQGYCYAAFLAKADLDERFGDAGSAEEWRRRAAELKARFREAFWLPDEGYLALALDRDKRPVDAIASNAGQCLWSGIVDEADAGAVVERLLSDEMFTGFGIRTLGTRNARYNPVSYHNGSVWPHDTALIAAGIARYGYTEQAQRVVDGLIDAVRAFGGRLPELFCGFDRTDKPVPVPYPTSCSPQAWAAAVPFELLRISLGLTPSGEPGRLDVGTAPERLGEVTIDKLPFEHGRVNVRADSAGGSVTDGSVTDGSATGGSATEDSRLAPAEAN